MKKTLPLLLALTSTSLFAGFDFNTCSGSGTFEQEIVHYGGDYENAATVGEIPQGIQGLKINLISDKDVDIRLYADNGDKIVHWPYGILNSYKLETELYQDVNVTYSGYNGTGGEKGHEFIQIEGTTPTAFTMKAFGYRAGYATVNYSWTGKEGCTPTTTGTGTFEQTILNKATNLVGTIPPNVENVEINLTSANDLDIQLFAQDGTAIARWNPAGLMAGATQESVIYHDMNITWSGFNGVNNQKGHEYITIEGKNTEMLIMKVYGYHPGVADVVYKWESDSIISIKGPTIIDREEEVTFSVKYKALQQRDLAVFLINIGNGDIYFYKRITVEEGVKSENITFTAPMDLPSSATYKYGVYIAPVGGYYGSNLDKAYQYNVSVRKRDSDPSVKIRVSNDDSEIIKTYEPEINLGFQNTNGGERRNQNQWVQGVAALDNGFYLTSLNIKEKDETGEYKEKYLLINLLDPNGRSVGNYQVPYVSHGQDLSIEKIDNKKYYIYSVSTSRKGIVKFLFDASNIDFENPEYNNKKLNIVWDKNIELGNDLSFTTSSINYEKNKFISVSYTPVKHELMFIITDKATETEETRFTFNLSPENDGVYTQGIVMKGDLIYLLRGDYHNDADGKNKPKRLFVFNRNSKRMVESYTFDFESDDFNITEPEGITIKDNVLYVSFLRIDKDNNRILRLYKLIDL